jgi:hypothetical protein
VRRRVRARSLHERINAKSFAVHELKAAGVKRISLATSLCCEAMTVPVRLRRGLAAS